MVDRVLRGVQWEGVGVADALGDVLPPAGDFQGGEAHLGGGVGQAVSEGAVEGRSGLFRCWLTHSGLSPALPTSTATDEASGPSLVVPPAPGDGSRLGWRAWMRPLRGFQAGQTRTWGRNT